MVSRGEPLRGWITVEIIFSLALLAVVLEITQHQMAQQWQSLLQRQADSAIQEDHQRQEAMVVLTGETAWRDEKPAISTRSYPSCQICSGKAFLSWFQAAQSKLTLSASMDRSQAETLHE